MLEEYWEKNRVREGDTEGDFGDDSLVSKDHLKSSPQVNGYRRPRAISDATATVTPNQTLSPHHPAISLPKLITEFGPLIYPLYRAALLRKRILMLGEPPVEQNCNFGTNNPVSILPPFPQRTDMSQSTTSPFSLLSPHLSSPFYLSTVYHPSASVHSSMSVFKTSPFSSFSQNTTNPTPLRPHPL